VQNLIANADGVAIKIGVSLLFILAQTLEDADI